MRVDLLYCANFKSLQAAHELTHPVTAIAGKQRMRRRQPESSGHKQRKAHLHRPHPDAENNRHQMSGQNARRKPARKRA